MLQVLPKVSTISEEDRNFIDRLNALDLEPIVFRVMHNESTMWSLEKADRIAHLYRAFFYLSWKYPNKAIVPNKAVDEFWHQHILDTSKYEEDCQSIFGHFLHHFPYFGMRGEGDRQALESAFAETLALLQEQFGQSIFGKSDIASDCLFVQDKARDCLFVQDKASDCLFVQDKASDCLFVQDKASDCLFVQDKASASSSEHPFQSVATECASCLFEIGNVNKVDRSRPRPIRA